MMNRKQALTAIEAIMDTAGISPEDMLDHFVEQKEREAHDQNNHSAVDILREGLIHAKDLTGLENDEIGEMINDVTGGAVGHWVRGRTRPSRENRIAIYQWIRSVENALNVKVLPSDFSIDQNGERIMQRQ